MFRQRTKVLLFLFTISQRRSIIQAKKGHDGSSRENLAKFKDHKFLPQDIHQYSIQWGFHESSIAKALRLTTESHERSVMMGHPTEAALFSVLLSVMNAKKVIEIGVFTGYTTLCMAEALKKGRNGNNDGAKIVALDISDEYCEIGKKYWKEAKVDDIIDLRLGPARKSLQDMIQQGESGTYDFAFIDADKVNYKEYYELLLKLVRKNGLIAIDNVLWSGKVVAERDVSDESTEALREISRHVHLDDRVEHIMLPFADGVTLVRKK